MIRVLQLLEADADFQTHRSVLTLCRGLGREFRVKMRTVGRGGTYRGAVAAWMGVKRQRERFDVVHAWGGRALAAVMSGFGGPLAYSPASMISDRAIRWLTAVMSYREMQVICPTATLRRRLVERGVALNRCHLIRPGVDFSRIKRRGDGQLRKELGFAQDDRVILLPGESSRAAGHELGLWAASILNVLDERYKVLLWGRGERTSAVLRLAEKLGRAGMVCAAEKTLGRAIEFEGLLAATDIVLVTAEEYAPTLPICICMAAALPIVSTVTYTTGELLEDRHSALMVSARRARLLARRARLLARRVLDVQEDSRLAWAISDMARTEAYEYFAQSRFVEQHRAAYRQMMEGSKLDLPEPVPGAGLRFHGRV